ncbi:MAG TPA: hypothetical protein VI231_12430 [Candidatus Binatia bacterium]
MSPRILLVLLLLLCGCASAAPARRSASDPELVDEIKPRLAALRGLAFKAPVPIEIKSRAEMLADFEREIADDYGEDGLLKVSLAYGKLGLIPEKVDLKKALLQFYGAEVVAYYDPRTKKLVMPDRGAGAGEDIPLVLAHELTHALQSQHFPSVERLNKATDDDVDLALRAIVEGDATLSGYAYIGASPQELMRFARAFETEMRGSMPALGGVPPALIEEMFFPYYAGAAFLAPLLGEGGWSDIDAVYASPPLSTEQVLHPEKYFSDPDPPTRVDFGDLAALFPADWKEIESNVLGEFMTRVLFEQHLPKDDARTAAEGWDGDRLVAYARGAEVAFVWATVWDSESDAEEFIQAYSRLAAKRSPGAYYYAERRGTQALVVDGLDRARVAAGVEQVWRDIRTKEEPFTPPRFGARRPTPAAWPIAR